MEGTRRAVPQGGVPLSPQARRSERPDPNDVRAVCPVCGSDVVSGAYYVPGRGYILRWTCWEAMGRPPSCDFKRVL
jgi:hypothetical protein